MKQLKLHRILLLAIGMLAVAAIAYTQLSPQTAIAQEKKAKTEQEKEQSDSAQTYLSIATTSLPSSTVQLHHDLSFVVEFLFEHDLHVEGPAILPDFNKLFNTLFRVIISPNAP